MNSEKKSILIVDDEPDFRVYLSTFFEDNGFSTVTAEDGKQAMSAVQASRPDLITLDITMPEKSGVRFYREMKEGSELGDIPIIIITGVTQDFQSFISSRHEVPPPDGYLAKPVDLGELLSTASKLMA